MTVVGVTVVDMTAVDTVEAQSPMLAVTQVKCHAPNLFIGAINWASYVPRAHEFGIRGDRCGFGAALGLG